MADSIPTSVKFTIPFASNGEKDVIPQSGSNVVSQSEGFPAVFSQGLKSDGKFVPRKGFNGVLNALSAAICNLQQGGLNRFDADLANRIGGYAEGAVLFHTVDSTTKEESLIYSMIPNNNFNPEENRNFIDKITDDAGNIVPEGTPGASLKWKTALVLHSEIEKLEQDVEQIRNRFQVVDKLPEDSDPDVFYFVKATT